MISDLMLSPVVLILGQWEHPIDLYRSTNKKIFKDKTRQIKIEIGGPNKYTFFLRKRILEEQSIPVRENLWRVKMDYSEWNVSLVLTMTEGFSKFVVKGIEFISELKVINKVQVRIGVYYNEPRNVSAAALGYNFHKISFIETGDNTKTGASSYHD